MRVLLKLLLIHLALVSTVIAGDLLPVAKPGVRAPKDTLFDVALSAGLELVYQDRFEESILLFDSLQAAFPDHPAPYFYRAAAYQTWMSSYRFNHFEKELQENVQLAIEKGDSLLQVRKDDPWLHFYIGAAYGYRAFFRVRRWNWIGAYRDGTRGIGNFRKALQKQSITLTAASLQSLNESGITASFLAELDKLVGKKFLGPDNFRKGVKSAIGKNGLQEFGETIMAAAEQDTPIYDVYLGLGSYHYWRTARSKFLRIIAFWMKDKRELGLEQIRFSIDHGRYCPAESYLVLVTALYDDGQYEQARIVLDEFRNYSGTPVMSSLYLRGRLMADDQNWSELRSIFKELDRRIKMNAYTSIGYQVECQYWIALSLKMEGEPEQALATADAALQLANRRDSATELEGQFEGFNDIREELQKLQKRLSIR